MRIDGRTRLAGLVGWPVQHSRSPAIHNHWLHRYGINGAYLPFPAISQGFEAAVRGLQAAGLAGINVTMPHKEAALALCDSVDEPAEATGVVNTLVFREDGTTHGRNTDAPGFIASLRQFVPDWESGAADAVVLGSGGAARAIIWALLQAGVPRIRLVNRSRAKAEALADRFGSQVALANEAGPFADCTLLVNTTSLGMTGQPPLVVNLDTLPRAAVVADIVTSPVQTPLLAEAAARGHRTADGLGMLLHQAAGGFESWFGIVPEVDETLRRHVTAG